jgi:transcription elongation factor/antiterminator RfaH
VYVGGGGAGVDARWYLLRTKPGDEARARAQVGRLAADVMLPLAKVRVRRWGRLVESVTPLFPCYLFARLDLTREYGRIRYTRGVRELVHFGAQAAIVPEWTISELKRRCAAGPVELPARELAPGERVRVVAGPLRDFEGIFERPLSGGERIAILLSLIGGAVRTMLPASMVVPVG